MPPAQQEYPPYCSSAAAFATGSLWAAAVGACTLEAVPAVRRARMSLVGIDTAAAVVAAAGIRMRAVVLDSLTVAGLALAARRTGRVAVAAEWILAAYVGCFGHLPVCVLGYFVCFLMFVSN